MRKLLLMAFLALLFIFPNMVYAADIVAEQDFNDSVAFYCSDDYNYQLAARFYYGFIKFIDNQGQTKYWLRLDYDRTVDKLLQTSEIKIDDVTFKITQRENPSDVYYRVGLLYGGRENYFHRTLGIPHAFFDLTPVIVNKLATVNKNTTVDLILNFQKRRGIKVPISASVKQNFNVLLNIGRSDYDKYAPKFETDDD